MSDGGVVSTIVTLKEAVAWFKSWSRAVAVTVVVP